MVPVCSGTANAISEMTKLETSDMRFVNILAQVSKKKAKGDLLRLLSFVGLIFLLT